MKKGGYSVRSTLDPELQRYADEALRKGVVAYDRRHGYRGPVARLPETARRALGRRLAERHWPGSNGRPGQAPGPWPSS